MSTMGVLGVLDLVTEEQTRGILGVAIVTQRIRFAKIRGAAQGRQAALRVCVLRARFT